MKQRTKDALARIGDIARLHQPELLVSKQQIKKVECIELVRNNRDSRSQSFGYAPRPFVMCNFPHKRPTNTAALYERFNGDFVLRILPDPGLGVPYGKDRIWPIFLSTVAVIQQSPVIRFKTASEILDLFGMHNSGHQFNRLVDGFKRIFSATIVFGPRDDIKQQNLFAEENGVDAPKLAFARERFHFIDKATLWYDRQDRGTKHFENEIVLNPTFFNEIMAHPIPTDLDAVRALADSPGALDLYMWLTYRCFAIAPGIETPVPLFGPHGLVHQLGSEQYARPRDFRRQLDLWLRAVRLLWPNCPAKINNDGDYLVLRHGIAMHRKALAAGS